MPVKYPHLLSPIKIGNHVLKNRMLAAPISPHLLPGPEPYPNDGLITFYANEARSGAAMVILSQVTGLSPRWEGDTLKVRAAQPNKFNPDKSTHASHFTTYDLVNGGCQNYLSQLTEAVHFYDSKCIMKPFTGTPPGYDVSPDAPPEMSDSKKMEKGAFGSAAGGADAPVQPVKKEIDEEMLEKIIEETVLKCALGKEVGFDGIFFYMCYRLSLMARFISKVTNHRTDKYGGSPENRIRFPLMMADAIKKRCGRDFLIIAAMSGCESREGGYTLEDAAEYARLLDGHVDMMYLKGDPGERVSTPSSLILERTPFLYMAESMKKKGVSIPVAVTGGFQDLDTCEEAVASGKADLLAMGRAWICNPDFGRLAYEGRNEDVVPCLRCNECYGSSFFKPWNSVCPVNPVWGLEHRIDKMISPPQGKKKVAVIGGGPAGMEAALTASRRGHEVTLYEKSDKLGGLLKDYEDVSFKWTHKDFKNYLVRQIAKNDIRVCLNTEVEPEILGKEEYDAVIAALGAEPAAPDIPGTDGKNVVFAVDVYGKETGLAEEVVVVGGGQTGVDTGIHLAEKGHNVTVLEMTDMLARDATPLHYYTSLKATWEKLPNFTGIVNARCSGITPEGVTYVDAEGREQRVKAGSVVVATGMKAKSDLALKFYGAGDRLYMVGDCRQAGDIQMAVRSAFSAASML